MVKPAESNHSLSNIEPDSRLQFEQQVRVGVNTEYSQFLPSFVRSGEKGYYACDATDEFQLERRDGSINGIFKVWAEPVIPIIETGLTDRSRASETWKIQLKDRPLALYQSLERWRAFAQIADRRLQEVFENREMPNDVREAFAELLLREEIAFAVLSPFYNLEALVVDNREDKTGNPINFNESSGNLGRLDAVAMALPSALADQIDASQLAWGKTSWETLGERTKALRSAFAQDPSSLAGRQFRIISKVADLAKVSCETVLFAANALQFIPSEVGGKAGDLATDQAISLLDGILSEPPDANVYSAGVAREVNALIRFMNWCPSIRSEDNFKGKRWNYDSVCATAGDLLEMAQEHADLLFDSDFAFELTTNLVPQLDGIDATSAKGRFILQQLYDGTVVQDVVGLVNVRREMFIKDVLEQLEINARQEKILHIDSDAPAYLVGGKAQGIRQARELFGESVVLGGIVVSSEAIRSWLRSLPDVNDLINGMKQLSDVQEKFKFGDELFEKISKSPFDNQLVEEIMHRYVGKKIVLRSSSSDEDVPIIGPAPGVYESVIGVDANDREAVESGIKEVIASFFSDKAVSFRDLKGLDHNPHIAVLVQEYIDGVGGSLFVHDGQIQLNIAAAPNHINGSNVPFENHHILSAEDLPTSMMLTQEQLDAVVKIARASNMLLGSSDIEFVIEPNTQYLKVLQLRALHHPNSLQSSKVNSVNSLTDIWIDDANDLPDMTGIEGSVRLRIAPGINLEKFQGKLFRGIVSQVAKVHEVVVPEAIPNTCHFYNILNVLGIGIVVPEA